MQAAYTIVWGGALLAIVGLLVALRGTLQRSPQRSSSIGSDAEASEPIKDTLLFYYEEDSVRSTFGARVIVHISGLAWDAGWREDLLRLEISELSCDAISLPSELGSVEVLAVYNLAAYRMTEMGTDIKVERFLEPIDVILTERSDHSLGLAIQIDRSWTLTPPANLSPRQFEGIDLPTGHNWAAALLTRLGTICLVQLPDEQVS